MGGNVRCSTMQARVVWPNQTRCKSICDGRHRTLWGVTIVSTRPSSSPIMPPSPGAEARRSRRVQTPRAESSPLAERPAPALPHDALADDLATPAAGWREIPRDGACRASPVPPLKHQNSQKHAVSRPERKHCNWRNILCVFMKWVQLLNYLHKAQTSALERAQAPACTALRASAGRVSSNAFSSERTRGPWLSES